MTNKKPQTSNNLDSRVRASKENSNKNSEIFSSNPNPNATASTNVKKVYSPKQSVQYNNTTNTKNGTIATEAKDNKNVLKEQNNKGNSLITGMKVHKGPLNLSSISMKDPIQLMKDIIIAIEELTINYKITSKFSAKCEKGNLKFLIEINFVENFTNLFAIKFYKSCGDNSKYADLCSNIFLKLSL